MMLKSHGSELNGFVSKYRIIPAYAALSLTISASRFSTALRRPADSPASWRVCLKVMYIVYRWTVG